MSRQGAVEDHCESLTDDREHPSWKPVQSIKHQLYRPQTTTVLRLSRVGGVGRREQLGREANMGKKRHQCNAKLPQERRRTQSSIFSSCKRHKNPSSNVKASSSSPRRPAPRHTFQHSRFSCLLPRTKRPTIVLQITVETAYNFPRNSLKNETRMRGWGGRMRTEGRTCVRVHVNLYHNAVVLWPFYAVSLGNMNS